jgi:hypothetical protein
LNIVLKVKRVLILGMITTYIGAKQTFGKLTIGARL